MKELTIKFVYIDQYTKHHTRNKKNFDVPQVLIGRVAIETITL